MNIRQSLKKTEIYICRTNPTKFCFCHIFLWNTSILFFGYLYCPPPSIITSSVFPNLLPLYLYPRFSIRVSEHRRNSCDQCSNLMNSIRIDARRSREDQGAHEDQSGHETMIQAEVGGIISPTDPDLIEGGGVVTPKNGNTVYLTVITAYFFITLYNTYDESVLKVSPVDTTKPSYYYDAANSSSSKYTPRTSSIYALSTSVSLPASFTSSSKSHNNT